MYVTEHLDPDPTPRLSGAVQGPADTPATIGPNRLQKPRNPQATLWAEQVILVRDARDREFDPARASVSTWIFTIARNRRIDFLRKQRRPDPEDLTWGPAPEPDQADVLALQQDTDRLGAAMQKLPEAQRDLIEKAYFRDLSQSEIAALTGLPLGTIKSRIRLALDRLRHALQ